MSLKKYFTYIPIEFKHFLSHRAIILSKVLSAPLSMLVLFILWNAIYDANESDIIGYFTKEQMLSYSVLSVIFSAVAYSYVDRDLGRRVANGNLISYLVKPEQYYWRELFADIGKKGCDALFVGLPSLVLGSLFFGLKLFSIEFTLISLVSLGLAYFLNYIFSMLFGLIAFRVSYYGNFGWLKETFVSFLSGGFVSLSIFPLWFQNITSYLPFTHMLYTPIRIFIGSYSMEQSLFYIGIQIFWIVLLFILMKFGWQRSIKKFEGAGA